MSQPCWAGQACTSWVSCCTFLYREAEASVHGQMQKIEVLCGVLDAALLRLPHWLSQPDLASSPSPTQDTLSQVRCRVHDNDGSSPAFSAP